MGNYFILWKNSDFKAFEHDDFGLIHSLDLCFAVGDQVNTDKKSQVGDLAHKAVHFSQVV